ncbi:lipid transferase CIDEB-like [Lethenteron reissneri]|uniref:lipid transferase CIDEB-like n=1 Tax=Lethenteron reissneri TaxID=7753 RepID=UPI002AB64B9A|nr:lipid transferase CIDEB-like [Lethenteron reissneri]
MDSSLSPKALLRSVSAAGVELTRRVWHGTAAAPPRPFRVCCSSRANRRGVMAASLQELLNKSLDVLPLPASGAVKSAVKCAGVVSAVSRGAVSVVLDEDGTVVDTEEFFDSLDDNVTLMVLAKGDTWSPPRGHSTLVLGTGRPKKGHDIARITLDLYKMSPRDLIGCLNVKATFYGMYSMTLDFKCLGAKRIITELLRVVAHLLQVSGRLLLGTAGYLRQTLDTSEFNLHPLDKSTY